MKRLFYFVLVLNFYSCTYSSPPTQPNRNQAIAKQEEAWVIFRNIVTNQTCQDSIQVVIDLLDESIALDTSYLVAYSTKVNVLNAQGKYTEAMEVIQLAIERDLAENTPEFIVGKGIQHDLLDQPELAMIDYKNAIIAFDKKYEPDTNYLLTTKALLHFLLGEEIKSIQDLKSIMDKNLSEAERISAEILLQSLQNKNREQFIEAIKSNHINYE